MGRAIDLRMQLNFDGMSNCERWIASTERKQLFSNQTAVADCTFGWHKVSVSCDKVSNHTSLELWLGLCETAPPPGAYGSLTVNSRAEVASPISSADKELRCPFGAPTAT